MKASNGKRVSVILVSTRGAALAAKVAESCPGALIHGPEELKTLGLKRVAARAFRSSDALVFISASGIAVRAIAPLLKHKSKDPAVVVMDEAGRFAVSLVSGHLGGANDLARRLARFTGALPVVTTATDAAGLPCIEEAASAVGCVIENPGAIKAVNSAILDGAAVRVVDRNAARRGQLIRILRAPASGKDKKRPVRAGRAPATVLVSASADAADAAGSGTLILRPREFVAGVGFMKGVGVAELEGAIREAMGSMGLSPLTLAGIATIDIKRGGPVERAAKRAGVEAAFYGAAELDGIKPPSGPSAAARHVGARAVAEPAALLMAGVRRLWLKKTKHGRVTVALARAPFR